MWSALDLIGFAGATRGLNWLKARGSWLFYMYQQATQPQKRRFCGSGEAFLKFGDLADWLVTAAPFGWH